MIEMIAPEPNMIVISGHLDFCDIVDEIKKAYESEQEDDGSFPTPIFEFLDFVVIENYPVSRQVDVYAYVINHYEEDRSLCSVNNTDESIHENLSSYASQYYLEMRGAV